MTEYLAMKRVAAKFVPKLLTVEQKQLHVEVSWDMLDSTETPTSAVPQTQEAIERKAISFYLPYNENSMRALNTTSIKYCLPSTDAIDRREKIHASALH